MQLFNFERFYNVLFKNKNQKVLLTICGIQALVTHERFDTLYPILHMKALVGPRGPARWKSFCAWTSKNQTGKERLLPPGAASAFTLTADLRHPTSRTRMPFAARPASSTAGVSFWGGQNAFPTSGREHELFHTNSCKSSLRKTNYCGLPFKLSRIKDIYFLERFFKLVSPGGDLKTCWNINWKAHFTGW